MTTDCPLCGSTGRLGTLTNARLYLCTNRKCRAEYFVQWKHCKACNEEIEDEYEYCYFHDYLGSDLPRQRREELCTICREQVKEDSEYCPEHHREFKEHDYQERSEEAH